MPPITKVGSILACNNKCDTKEEVVVEIHSGKNRVIHRMFLHLGYSVEKLDRLWYAGLNKKSLKRGEWKHLSEQEIRSIKKLVKL